MAVDVPRTLPWPIAQKRQVDATKEGHGHEGRQRLVAPSVDLVPTVPTVPTATENDVQASQKSSFSSNSQAECFGTYRGYGEYFEGMQCRMKPMTILRSKWSMYNGKRAKHTPQLGVGTVEARKVPSPEGQVEQHHLDNGPETSRQSPRVAVVVHGKNQIQSNGLASLQTSYLHNGLRLVQKLCDACIPRSTDLQTRELLSTQLLPYDDACIIAATLVESICSGGFEYNDRLHQILDGALNPPRDNLSWLAAGIDAYPRALSITFVVLHGDQVIDRRLRSMLAMHYIDRNTRQLEQRKSTGTGRNTTTAQGTPRRGNTIPFRNQEAPMFCAPSDRQEKKEIQASIECDYKLVRTSFTRICCPTLRKANDNNSPAGQPMHNKEETGERQPFSDDDLHRCLLNLLTPEYALTVQAIAWLELLASLQTASPYAGHLLQISEGLSRLIKIFSKWPGSPSSYLQAVEGALSHVAGRLKVLAERRSADSWDSNATSSQDHNTPINDLISQCAISLQIAKTVYLRYTEPHGKLTELLGELCHCLAAVEEAIAANGTETVKNNFEKYNDRHEQLFLGLYRTFVQARGRAFPSCETLDIKHAVEDLLALSSEEIRTADGSEEVYSLDNEVLPRPFTAVLASVRGAASGNIFNIIIELLQKASNPSSRDFHRRALIRLVQAADRLPNSLWIPVELDGRLVHASGSFSQIYRGKIFNTAQDIAIKAPRALVMLPREIKDRRLLYTEIVSWKTVTHPRLLPFLGLARLTGISNLCMLSPFMEKGTLRYGCNATTAPATRMRYIKEIVEGMVYLHDEGIVHGDLRAANVFIADEGHIRIADFGLSVFSEGLSKNYFSMRSGSARWLAPELLDPIKYRKQSGDTDEIDWSQLSSRPTKPSDVYTFSCLCIELFSGKAPFENINNDNIVATIVPRPHMRRPPRPDNMPYEFWELLQQCWCDNAGTRLSFRTIGQRLRDLNAC